jgi:hypothetical protein
MMDVRLVGNSDFESSVNGTGTAHMCAYDLAGQRTVVGGWPGFRFLVPGSRVFRVLLFAP